MNAMNADPLPIHSLEEIATDPSGALFAQWSQNLDVSRHPDTLSDIIATAKKHQNVRLISLMSPHITALIERSEQFLVAVEEGSAAQCDLLLPLVPNETIALTITRALRAHRPLYASLTQHLNSSNYIKCLYMACTEGHEGGVRALLRSPPKNQPTQDSLFWVNVSLALCRGNHLSLLDTLWDVIPSQHHAEIKQDVLSASVGANQQDDVRWALNHGITPRPDDVKFALTASASPSLLQLLVDRLNVEDCQSWDFEVLRDAVFSQNEARAEILYHWSSPKARQKVMNEVQAHMDYYHPDNTELHPHTPIKYKAMAHIAQLHSAIISKDNLEQSLSALDTDRLTPTRPKKI